MRKSFPVLFVVFVWSIFVLAACAEAPPAEGELPAVPAEYAGKTNPLGSEAVAAGQALYEERCSACHGPTGLGDGPAAAALDPKPPILKDVVGIAGDDFLFWRISEGGAMAPFNSAMPAQKGILTEEQIWQLVTYIKTFE